MDWQVVSPAYGRDYKSGKEARADWNAGKDFRCEPQGCYINKREADEAGITVEIRYKRLMELIIVEPKRGGA